MSGAKNCPETPRQKMIGMMYLVLTAMLALNVSSDILNGFTLVDNSLHTSIESAEKRNADLYSDFDDLYKKNPTKVREWLTKANSVKKESNDLYSYIENFKVQVVKIADKAKADPKARKIEGRDNLDAAGIYAINGGNGKILKSKIDEYGKKIFAAYEGNPTKQELYSKIFSTERISYEKTWESSMFELMPVSAVVTMLTKYQNDIRAAEAELVQYLKSRTDASDFRVNKVEALVIPESKFVFTGDRYKARIVLSAVDSTTVPEYYVGGSRIAKGIYETSATSIGLKNYSGEIRMQGNDGNTRTYKFKSEYMVSQPSATISNSDLNVVYRGIVNNFSVSVPGIAPENIILAVAGGKSVQKGPGKYEISTMSEGELTISVSAKIDKAVKAMGSGKFRIKKLPKPTAYLVDRDGNQTQGGLMSVDELRNSTMIASYGKDELVKANFRIVSFTMIVDGLPTSNVSGAKLDQNFLNKLTKGRSLIISNIVAVGPDGYNQNLGAMVFRLA
ncbi:MAG: gliding motility protein GldM [Paludibacter sp.]